MIAEIRHVISEIRIWIDDSSKYGDPYYLFILVKWIDKDIIELSGVDKPITRKIWNAIHLCCLENKIKEVHFKRFHKGVQSMRVLLVSQDGLKYIRPNR